MKSVAPHIGTWLSIGSPVIAELAAFSGFDWALLDGEHGCAGEAAIPDQLRALTSGKTRGIVRVGAPYPDLIARVLDWGADGVMVPHVNTAAEAEAIVRSLNYPPRGRRGYSRTVRAYEYGLKPPKPHAPQPLFMAQIESVEGVTQSFDIAKVEGVDVLFVGPADLKYDLQNQAGRSEQDFSQCLETVLEAAKAANKAAGILIRDVTCLQHHIDMGFTHIALDSDLSILRNAYKNILSTSI